MTFTAPSDGTGYQWYEDQTIIPGATTDTYTATTPGSYYAKYTEDPNCDQQTGLFILVDNCANGDVVDINLGLNPGEIVTWSTGETTEEISIVSTMTMTEYTADVMLDGGTCNTEYLFVVQNLFALPECNVPSAVEICGGSTFFITENGGDAISWLWSSSGATTFDDNTAQSPIASGAVAGEIITVEVTDANGCTSTCSTTVTADESPANDCDNDGVYDACDLDDDNDGILDIDEASPCPFVKSDIVTTSDLDHYVSSPVTNLTDGDNAVRARILGDQVYNDLEVVKWEFLEAITLDMIEIINVSTGGGAYGLGAKTVRIEGSNDNATWTDLSGDVVLSSTAGAISGQPNSYNFSLSTTGLYKYYRVFGVDGSADNAQFIEEANFNQIDALCDVDCDGILNECDTNADGDLCTDAEESSMVATDENGMIAGGVDELVSL